MDKARIDKKFREFKELQRQNAIDYKIKMAEKALKQTVKISNGKKDN